MAVLYRVFFKRAVFKGGMSNRGVFDRAVNLEDLQHSTQYKDIITLYF